MSLHEKIDQSPSPGGDTGDGGSDLESGVGPVARWFSGNVRGGTGVGQKWDRFVDAPRKLSQILSHFLSQSDATASRRWALRRFREAPGGISWGESGLGEHLLGKERDVE